MATSWVMTKSADNLLRQVNNRFPFRDKASDGGIGDLPHQLESASSHNPDKTGNAEWEDGDSKNEVRARDFDNNLRDEYGVTCEQLVQYLVKLARAAYLAGAYFPIRYIIYNGRIWSVTWGWTTRTYTGASPHTEHFHSTFTFSQRADEDDDYDYHLDTLGDPMPTLAEIQTLLESGAVARGLRNQPNNLSDTERSRLIQALLDTPIGDPDYPARTIQDLFNDLANERGYNVGDPKDTVSAKIPATSPLGKLGQLDEQVADLQGKMVSMQANITQILNLLQTPAAKTK